MEASDKQLIQLKIAVCIDKLISERKKGKIKDYDFKSVTSLRKLAAAAEVEYTIIQKIAAAQRNPALSTVIAIADGFNISTAEFFAVFDQVKPKEIEVKRLAVKKRVKAVK